MEDNTRNEGRWLRLPSPYLWYEVNDMTLQVRTEGWKRFYPIYTVTNDEGVRVVRIEGNGVEKSFRPQDLLVWAQGGKKAVEVVTASELDKRTRKDVGVGVRVVETCEEWPTIKAASLATGVTTTLIHYRLQHGVPKKRYNEDDGNPYRWCSWEYVDDEREQMQIGKIK